MKMHLNKKIVIKSIIKQMIKNILKNYDEIMQDALFVYQGIYLEPIHKLNLSNIFKSITVVENKLLMI